MNEVIFKTIFYFHIDIEDCGFNIPVSEYEFYKVINYLIAYSKYDVIEFYEDQDGLLHTNYYLRKSEDLTNIKYIGSIIDEVKK